MVYGLVIGMAITIGLVVWYGSRKAYLARKEAGLKATAAALAKDVADKASEAVQDAAKKVS